MLIDSIRHSDPITNVTNYLYILSSPGLLVNNKSLTNCDALFVGLIIFLFTNHIVFVN